MILFIAVAVLVAGVTIFFGVKDLLEERRGAQAKSPAPETADAEEDTPKGN